jgi:dTMP kinase
MLTDKCGSPRHRGAFILLEGVDRCGKTTQAKLLLQRFLQMGVAATALRFPDRTTPTGRIIDKYLQQQQEVDDHSIHLLFSSNRWEAAGKIQNLLQAGTTIVCDRYAYSGVAFSAAKVVHDDDQRPQDDNVGNTTGGSDGSIRPLLDLEWCKAPDRGLPAPDCVLFLDLSADQAEARGGYVYTWAGQKVVVTDENVPVVCLFLLINVCGRYGGERYEKRDMQLRVREVFRRLQEADDSTGNIPWTVVDASQTIEQVHDDIWDAANVALSVSATRPIGTMFASRHDNNNDHNKK